MVRIPAVNRTVVRALRMTATFAVIFGVLYLRFASGVIRGTEVDRVVPWAFLVVSLLFGTGAWAMEVTGAGPLGRRDQLWGMTAALSSFALLRLTSLL
jgi:hypothetical protein